MYVCISIHFIHTLVMLHTYVHTYTYTVHTYIRMCLCTCIHAMNICACICVHVHMYVCMYKCLHMCTYVRMCKGACTHSLRAFCVCRIRRRKSVRKEDEDQCRPYSLTKRYVRAYYYSSNHQNVMSFLLCAYVLYVCTVKPVVKPTCIEGPPV